MKKAIIYIRVSTSKQGKSGLGLEDQTNKCLQFCQEQGLEVLDVYCDSDVSGKIDPEERPALSKALQHAKNEGARIVVKSLCRISREVYHVSGLMRHNIDFVVCDHPNAPSFLLHVLAAMGQFEREQISKRTKDALAVAKKRGVKLGSNNPVIKAAIEKQSLQTIKTYHPILMKCLQNEELTYRGKFSMNKTAKWLTENEVKTPRGKTTWSAQQVKQLFSKFKDEDNPFAEKWRS